MLANFGPYQMVLELGHGGMADVFLAVRSGPEGLGFSKLTVVKKLRPNLAEDPEFIQMLIDEARIAARLNHPNIVQTNEVGQVDKDYFIAMEYLDGQPLHRIESRTREEGPRERVRERCAILADVLAGLHYAHDLTDYNGTPLGIVHRDVSPQNIFVTYEGQSKLVDFGIAKAAGRLQETREGVVKGKVQYMAPEHAIGGKIDRRADVFAVGVILYDTITGRRFWGNEDGLVIMRRLADRDLPKLPDDPTIPAKLREICEKAIAIHPKDRYDTAADFQQALEDYLRDNRPTQREIGKWVSDMFRMKILETKKAIEMSLAELPTHPKLPAGTAPVSTPSEQGYSVKEAAPASRRSVAWGALAFAMALGGAVWLYRTTAARSAVVASPNPVASTTGATPAASNDVAQATLIANPPSARFTIGDDPPLGTNPVMWEGPKDGQRYRVRIAAPGYAPQVLQEQLSQVGRLEVSLVPLPTSVNSAPPAASSSAPPPASARPRQAYPRQAYDGRNSVKSAPTAAPTVTAVATATPPATPSQPDKKGPRQIELQFDKGN